MRFTALSFAFLALLCLYGASAQLDASEVTALQAIKTRFSSVLSNPSYTNPTWPTDLSDACNVLPYGVYCNAAGHVIRLELSGIPLNGELPSEITGLTHLTQLFLRQTGLRGTLPADLRPLVNLTSLRLDQNQLNLCATQTLLPAGLSPASCQVQDQDFLRCGLDCCGCNGNWTSVCNSNIPPCSGGSCPYPAPEGSNVVSICYDNEWYLPQSHSGSLIVSGPVHIIGDFSATTGNPVVFLNLESSLEVTGKVTLTEPVVFYLSDEDTKTLKTLGTLNSHRRVFLVAGQSDSRIPSFAFGHSRRHCLNPYTLLTKSIDVPAGYFIGWSVSLRYKSTCSTWWIVLLCCAPAIIGMVAALIIPFC